MNIFYGDNDNRDFGNPSKYAFLNWWTDDGHGESSNSIYQYIFNNYTFGKAFIGEAILSLHNIIKSGNVYNQADKLIFPILFNVWHGIELWLKSSITAFKLLVLGEESYKKRHEIIKYSKELNILLKKHSCNLIVSKSLNSLNLIINEFEKVNAHFDFARYSFDKSGEFQFYNAPYSNKRQWQKANKNTNKNIVPNTCVDILGLFECLTKVFEEFGTFVEYLTLCISHGGSVSDNCYQKYLTTIENHKKNFEEFDLKNLPFDDFLFREIMN